MNELLDVLPLLIAYAGLVAYTVLGGADFGAGAWLLLAGRGERGRLLREQSHRAIGPVWEANHVWLVLVLTVVWTAYPVVFGSVVSTLSTPIFLAAVGIVLRGVAYGVRGAADGPRERRAADALFAASSVLTPFMLGAVVGGVATGRVPVGNAAGDLLTSWWNPTSVLGGVLAVTVGAFLAAVYLAAVARDRAGPEVERAFRGRALAAGAVAGALSLGGLAVVRVDAPRLFTGLTSGWGLAAVATSAAAGITALALVATRQFGAARGVAALAVAALLGGWAAAQRPDVLPGLTLAEASADPATLLSVVLSVAIGAVVLTPSLLLLFRLDLSGRLDPGPRADDRAAPERAVPSPGAARLGTGRAALALLAAGVLLLTVAGAGVAHALGVVALLAAAVCGFAAVGPDRIAADPAPDAPRRR